MVRLKRQPSKSLSEIDYSHPSVVFWFFGTTPTKSSLKNGSNLRAANGLTPPVINSSTAVPIATANGKIEKKNHLPGDNKRLKPNNKVNGSNGITLPEPALEIIEKNGKNLKLVHPLASHPEIPPLNDLQAFITEAILLGESGSSSFELIFEYVSKRWRNIKRRDGSNYTTDCRRAIQANLRHNPHHIALFRRDKHNAGNWIVCTSIDEAVEASKEGQAESRRQRFAKVQKSAVVDEDDQDEDSPQNDEDHEQEQEPEPEQEQEPEQELEQEPEQESDNENEKTSKRRIEDEEDSKDKMDEDNSQDSDEDPEASSGEKKK